MVIHILVSAFIYTVTGVALGSIATLGLRRATYSHRRLVGAAAIVGAFSALLYLQPFLAHRGVAMVWDPAAYFGSWLTVNPLVVLAAEYGWAQAPLAFFVSSAIAVGSLATLAVSAAIGRITTTHALKVGAIGGITVVASGLLYGYVYDATANPVIAPFAALVSFAVYPLSAYLLAPKRSVAAKQGASADSVRYPRCGWQEGDTGARFCSVCGASLAADPSTRS